MTVKTMAKVVCGLDVHQATVVACLLDERSGTRRRRQVRTFSTTPSGLTELRTWLQAEGCVLVGMESTGVYWMPVYETLEDAGFTLIVGNAKHMRNVPGRKTDMKDAEWIAQLICLGMVRPSFIPPRDIREIRKLVRYRRSVVQQRSSARNRVHKHLEQCRVKLAMVISDVFGASGTVMLRALVTGTLSPRAIAELARGTMRRKIDELAEVLSVRLSDNDRWILDRQLVQLGQLDAEVNAFDERIDLLLEPYRAQRSLLEAIPGMKGHVSAAFIAEAGATLESFPTDRHFAKWVGLCPANNESAGKSRRMALPQGNPYLRSILVEAAKSAVKKKGSYLRDKFFKLKGRKHYNTATLAIAHKLLRIAYHVIKDGTLYQDLGDTYLDRRRERQVVKALVKRFNGLGYEVELRPRAA